METSVTWRQSRERTGRDLTDIVPSRWVAAIFPRSREAQIRGAALAAGSAVAAVGANIAWQRLNPRPLPYSARWVLGLPRPYLGVSRLRAALDPSPGERILEIGSGTGYYSLSVARWIKPNGQITAVDIQPEMVVELRRRADREGIDNVVVAQGDACNLQYTGGTFDAVYIAMVLGEIPDWRVALQEARRLLKPTGRLVVGETPFDPHFVPLGLLCRQANEAGLELGRIERSRIAYFARFDIA